MKETELKPCPFCNNENAVLVTCCDVNCHNENCGDCVAQTFAICCDFNKGGCGAVGGYRKTMKEAIEAWNRRADNEKD